MERERGRRPKDETILLSTSRREKHQEVGALKKDLVRSNGVEGVAGTSKESVPLKEII